MSDSYLLMKLCPRFEKSAVTGSEVKGWSGLIPEFPVLLEHGVYENIGGMPFSVWRRSRYYTLSVEA
jgi:hypothetical protein